VGARAPKARIGARGGFNTGPADTRVCGTILDVKQHMNTQNAASEATDIGLTPAARAEDDPRPPEPLPVIVVSADAPKRLIDFPELYKYRELIAALVIRELTVRYKQALIGFAWIAIQPIVSTVVFTVLFGIIARFPSNNARYPTFVLTGLLFWSYFQKLLSDGTNCLVANQGMITKVYFPRIIIPLSHAVEGLVDFAIVLVLLLGLQLAFGNVPGPSALLLPLFLAVAMVFGFGLACFTGALYVLYRDVRFIVGFALQVGFFLTPIVYPVSFFPAGWTWLLALNPLTLVIEGGRWALLGTDSLPTVLEFVLSLSVTVATLLGGIWYFRHVEGRFADSI
jgi:lipopolysaccharide transport system permease protein